MLRKQSEKFGIDAVDDAREIVGIVQEIEVVYFNNKHFSWIFLQNKLFVALVEIFQIRDRYALFVISSASTNVFDEMRHRGTKINEKVGQFDQGSHDFKEFHVGVEVAFIEIAHIFIVGRKDVYAFKDAAVLHNGSCALGNGKYIFESFFQEEDFKVERPSFHIFVEDIEIGVFCHAFKFGRPSIVLRKKGGECGFSATDVSRNGYVHDVESGSGGETIAEGWEK